MGGRQFWGGTFHEAFPDIQEYEIRIEQDLFGQYVLERNRRFSIYRTGDAGPPREIPCINPKCQGGGLDLESYLLDIANVDRSINVTCSGYEENPTTRRGMPCSNQFKATIKIRRKPRM